MKGKPGRSKACSKAWVFYLFPVFRCNHYCWPSERAHTCWTSLWPLTNKSTMEPFIDDHIFIFDVSVHDPTVVEVLNPRHNLQAMHCSVSFIRFSLLSSVTSGLIKTFRGHLLGPWAQAAIDGELMKHGPFSLQHGPFSLRSPPPDTRLGRPILFFKPRYDSTGNRTQSIFGGACSNNCTTQSGNAMFGKLFLLKWKYRDFDSTQATLAVSPRDDLNLKQWRIKPSEGSLRWFSWTSKAQSAEKKNTESLKTTSPKLLFGRASNFVTRSHSQPSVKTLDRSFQEFRAETQKKCQLRAEGFDFHPSWQIFIIEIRKTRIAQDRAKPKQPDGALRKNYLPVDVASEVLRQERRAVDELEEVDLAVQRHHHREEVPGFEELDHRHDVAMRQTAARNATSAAVMGVGGATVAGRRGQIVTQQLDHRCENCWLKLTGLPHILLKTFSILFQNCHERWRTKFEYKIAEFRISVLFQYFMYILAKFNTFSRSWNPISRFNTFSTAWESWLKLFRKRMAWLEKTDCVRKFFFTGKEFGARKPVQVFGKAHSQALKPKPRVQIIRVLAGAKRLIAAAMNSEASATIGKNSIPASTGLLAIHNYSKMNLGEFCSVAKGKLTFSGRSTPGLAKILKPAWAVNLNSH